MVAGPRRPTHRLLTPAPSSEGGLTGLPPTCSVKPVFPVKPVMLPRIVKRGSVKSQSLWGLSGLTGLTGLTEHWGFDRSAIKTGQTPPIPQPLRWCIP
jgi:hypothetical protein